MAKRSTRKAFVWLASALPALALIGTLSLAANSWAADAPAITVGLSITQTGPFSAPALFELHGYQLAADQINQHGGLLGKQIKLVYYDDQANPSTGVQLYQKLITSDRVDLLLGPYETDLVAAVAPIVTRAKMLMPALGANVGNYQGQYPYLVQAIAQTGQYMAPVVDLAAAKGYKTIALLVQETQFPKEVAQGIKEGAAKKGLQIVFESSYPPGTTDFGPLVLKGSRDPSGRDHRGDVPGGRRRDRARG